MLLDIETRTQVPKTALVFGSAVLCTLLILVNALAAPTSNLVGWALPAYLSFRALETPAQDDDVQWLTYWIVFGFFNFIESFALRVLLYYLPFYYAFKTVFVLWLQLPATRVSMISPIITFFLSLSDPLRPLLCLMRQRVTDEPYLTPSATNRAPALCTSAF